MPPIPAGQPRFDRYHESLSAEIDAIKNRIRDLVDHWPTDGAWKEVSLRNVLRRHLPETVIVGSGFVVTPTANSSQIDILIIDRSAPTLFKDGDLLIVTPEAVRAAIEVKSSCHDLDGVQTSLSKLARVPKLCSDNRCNAFCWTGLFVVTPDGASDRRLLEMVGQAKDAEGGCIDCVACGRDMFLRLDYHPADDPHGGGVWNTYELPGVAPSYFVGNLIEALTDGTRSSLKEPGRRAWYHLPDGKGEHGKLRMKISGCRTIQPYPH